MYLLDTIFGIEIGDLKKTTDLQCVYSFHFRKYSYVSISKRNEVYELHTFSTYFTKMGFSSNKWCYYFSYLTQMFRDETLS